MSGFDTNKLTIVIGNRKYSSWSLRGWLALRLIAGKNNFNEIFCPLAGQGASPEAREAAKQKILENSPTGKVPALIDGELGITIVESLAIVLHLADRFPESELFPEDPAAKALAISAAAEMHAGFMGLRMNCSMHSLAIARKHGEIAFAKPEVQQDVLRLQQLWEGLLDKFGTGEPNSFLFGSKPSVADIMYAPVAIRFKAYDPDHKVLSKKSQDYVNTLLNMEAVQEWIDGAKLESSDLDIAQYESYAD